MAEAQGLGDQRGAIVADLAAGGPSQRAGLVAGDVIVSINGHPIKSSSELTREVAKAHPGDTLHLEVIRDGKRRTIDVRSGTRPSEKELAANENSQEGGGGSGGPQAQRAPSVLGLNLAPLDDSIRRQLGLPASVRGAVVLGVDSGSDAGEKGLKRGDVIVRAGDAPVANAGDVSAAVQAAKKAKRQSVLVGVYRGGRTLFLPLKIEG
jgi:serine protease Do